MAPVELRCRNGILLGVLFPDEGILELKCKSNRCGHRPGAIVLHRFTTDGNFVGTRKFTDPVSQTKKE